MGQRCDPSQQDVTPYEKGVVCAGDWAREVWEEWQRLCPHPAVSPMLDCRCYAQKNGVVPRRTRAAVDIYQFIHTGSFYKIQVVHKKLNFFGLLVFKKWSKFAWRNSKIFNKWVRILKIGVKHTCISLKS